MTNTLPMTFEPTATRRFAVHDRVAVPDGSVGTVIGFYRRAAETVLVLFGSGGSREFAPADLQRLE
jgi:hypothetical protein